MVFYKFMDVEKTIPGIKKNILLKDFATFKVGGRAKYFLIARKKEDLIKTVIAAKKLGIPFFVLGGGSNILFSDKGFKGIIIKIQFSDLKIKGSRIFAEAGTSLALLVNKTMQRNLSGLEWAAGIPGTIGGAVRGNAGAFGGEIKNAVERVETFDFRSSRIKIIKNRDCQFDYRQSIFKKRKNLIILSVVFKFRNGNKEKITKMIKKYLAYRKLKHPKKPSAGSIFKNVKINTTKKYFFKKFPEAKENIKEKTLPAAFLIDQCHLAGKKIGEAKVSKNHPNFIINSSNAKAKDIKKLINFIKKRVKNKFGIILEEEINYLEF